MRPQLLDKDGTPLHRTIGFKNELAPDHRETGAVSGTTYQPDTSFRWHGPNTGQHEHMEPHFNRNARRK